MMNVYYFVYNKLNYSFQEMMNVYYFVLLENKTFDRFNILNTFLFKYLVIIYENLF